VPTSTTPPFFYRPDALPAAQPTVSKHWRQLAHIVTFKLYPYMNTAHAASVSTVFNLLLFAPIFLSYLIYQYSLNVSALNAFSALTLLTGPLKIDSWGTRVVICLQWGENDSHMVQPMPLPSHHLLLHQNPDWFNLSGGGLPGCPGKKCH